MSVYCGCWRGGIVWKGVRTVYLKAAFVEICLHGRGETVAATICCQIRVSDAARWATLCRQAPEMAAVGAAQRVL